MNTLEENKKSVTAVINALYTKGDLGAVDAFLAEDFVDHDPPFLDDTTREGMRTASRIVRAACPDWHSEPDLLIAEGDLVVEHFTACGTQRGELLGGPATDRAIILKGINIFRVRDGRIVERWSRLDELGLLRQLGQESRP
ncbi:ester cyclase [Streptacidiphilus melanogenes]|uniref:ester cyclase n=1 Tax=Streptacidiphilus melanogenes TaxID=411235 RepID=UPI0005A90C55|nr:ester cyclase [Streptacidiphilus melanogenes]